MSEEKKVSVIVPAYNVQNYIKASIDSIILQTYRNLEIIVIDDGSSDDTPMIIEQLAEKDDRIVSICQKNGGVSDARNNGLSVATGEYICFLDADDTAEVFAIDKLVKAMEQSGADLVGSQYSRWDENGDRLEDFDFHSIDRFLDTDAARLSFIADELIPYHMGFEVWGKLFKSEIIRKGKVQFDRKCHMGEDLSFNIKYILNCDRIFTIPERCVRYLIRKGSAMTNTGMLSQRLKDDLIILKDVWNYVNETGKTEIIDRFEDLFLKILDHAFSKCNALEAAEAFQGIEDKSFAKDRYKKAACTYKNFQRLYYNDNPNRRLAFHQYVRNSIDAGKISDLLFMLVCRAYQSIRKQGKFEEWRLPY